MRHFVSFDFGEQSQEDVYNVTSRLVVPRPIALVSSVSHDGVANLAPFSFFNLGGLNPPSLSICIATTWKGEKDTLANIEATGEFVVNLVDRAMAESMNRTSAPLPAHHDEWEETDFSSLPSVRVAPKRVSESPAQFECRLYQVIRHGSGGGSSAYVIGEILLAHVDESALSPDFQPIARIGGSNYLDLATGQPFTMERPGD